jgi:hypothetical protein
MDRYDVYFYTLPKVENDKLLSPGAHETKQFTSVDEAKKAMADARTKWERIILIRTTDGAQTRIERYRDGAIEPFPERREPEALAAKADPPKESPPA